MKTSERGDRQDSDGTRRSRAATGPGLRWLILLFLLAGLLLLLFGGPAPGP